MKYGSETDTTVTDDNGSTISVTTSYKDGVPMKPQVKETQIRVKVRTVQDEMKEYIQFTDEAARAKEAGSGKVATSFNYEYTNHGREHGYYFVVKCFREVIK